MACRTHLPPKIFGDFICRDCGTRTDTLEWYFEDHGEPCIEPCRCGGDYDNAVKCVYCREDIPESRAKLDNDGEYACEACFNEAEEEETLETA